MGNCSTCGCDDDTKTEENATQYELSVQGRNGSFFGQNGLKGAPSNEFHKQQSRDQKKPKEKFCDSHYVSNVKKITKIQALWRGYRERRAVEYYKLNERYTSKYFLPDDCKETLSRRKYDPQVKRETRQPYTFKSGAVYTGEWKGGFRDGFGI